MCAAVGLSLLRRAGAAAAAGDYRRQWRKRYIQIWVDEVEPRIRYYRDFEVGVGVWCCWHTYMHAFKHASKQAAGSVWCGSYTSAAEVGLDKSSRTDTE